MALLGNGGILELSREWPEPMALAQSAINHSSTPKRIILGNPNYWTGDQVILNFPDGSPFDQTISSGSGIYFGSIWALSSARQHLTGPNGNYYQGNNSVNFYDNSPINDTTTGYINIDALGRVRLFHTELAAYNLDATEEILIGTFSTGNFVFARYSDSNTYSAGISTAANSIKSLTLPSDSQLLETVTSIPSTVTDTSEDPDGRGWLVQCELTQWALDVDAANLDMTAIGEAFGEQSKAIARGAGSLQFLIDNKFRDGEQTSLSLLRIVLITQRNTKASAKFYLYKDRTPIAPQVGNTAYYSCDLLLTNSKINVRAGELIEGSTDFVVTGEVGLRFA